MSVEAPTTYFYVRVPSDDPDPMWRVKHADETVQTVGAFFVMPQGVATPESDGTYEVRALAPSTVNVVRGMLTTHEGLTIERELTR